MQLFLTLAGGKLSGSDRVRTLSSGSLSIGRGPGNDWVLPDPARIVSNSHCIISAEDGRFVLTDLSSNGVYINGAEQATARDSRIVLADGDQFRLGDYVITVAGIKGEPAGPVSPVEANDPLANDPLVNDPLGDLRGDPLFRHPVARTPASARSEDPFDLKSQSSRRRKIEPDDDLFRGIAASGDWHGAPKPDHVAAPKQSIPPPRVVEAVPPGEIDFDALLGDLLPREAQASPQPEPMRTPVPEPPVSVAVTPKATARPDESAIGARAALDSFLEGAGVRGQPIGVDDPEAALRAAGEVFRAMADGVREILISRAAIKGEMRLTQTLIRARGNNALKFAPSADDAVMSLLTPKRPGYMEPLDAAREAFTDIKSHELAVIAGMQNALLALLRRFDPDALEERLAKGRLDAVLPAARKARYWDAFRMTYGEISREAEDDFQAAFGRSFAKAYKALTVKGRPPDD